MRVMRVWQAAVTIGAAAFTAAARDGCGPRMALDAPAGPGQFGRAMAAIGDIDGDGWSDLAVGDPDDSAGGAHAGAVHLYSGRTGALIRSIVGAAGSATGTAIAACGDVNGDGVPDVLIGAPGHQPPATNANTQPYKMLPAVKAMSTQRVDFVCAAGDSNHFYGTYGFDAGIQAALIERVPMYATPIHSANENNGLVLTRWGSFVINSTGSSIGSMATAPAFFNAFWDVAGAPAEINSLHRYAYLGPGEQLGAGAPFALRLAPEHPLNLTSELVFHINYGAFQGGEGYLAPEVHYADIPPYEHLHSWPIISTASPSGDEMRVASLTLPPAPLRRAALQFRLATAEGVEVKGPAFLSWLRVENPARTAGFSFNTMWAVGGKSARDAAQFIRSVPLSSLTHYFAEARRLQGPDKKIVIFMNEGGNDRLDWRQSYHGTALSWQPAGFRDNMTTVRDRILEVWDANGWPREELYFLLLGYHVLSDDPSGGLLEGTVIELRRVCRELAAEWPRSTCIDMSAFMTEAEAISKNWYTDSLHAHLRGPGYAELGKRIVAAMFSNVAQPGSARVCSGADGSTLLVVAPEIAGEAGDEKGYSVAAGPDSDGDGIGDFIIGAPSRFNEVLPGRAYLCSGATGGVIRTLAAADGRDRFGESVGLAADLDGDGLADPIVGSADDRQVAPGVGSVSAWSSGTGLRLWRATGGQGIESFASSIVVIGDADLDGRDDVVVGIPGRARHGANTGSVRVYSGATGSTIVTIDGRAAEERFGVSVAAVGDVDGDGRGDFAVGAPGADIAASNAGQVRIFGAGGAGGARRLGEISGLAAGDAAGAVIGPGGVTPEGSREVLALAGGRVLVLEASGLCCTADLNGDGGVDFADYLDFLNLYEAGDALVDFNGDGLIDFSDYLDFLVRFDIGC